MERHATPAAASSPVAAGKPCSVCGHGQGAPSHSIGSRDSVQCGCTNRQDLSSLPRTSNSGSKSERVPTSEHTTDARLAETCSSESTFEKQPAPPQQHQEGDRGKREKQRQTCEFDYPPFCLNFGEHSASSTYIPCTWYSFDFKHLTTSDQLCTATVVNSLTSTETQPFGITQREGKVKGT